MDNAKHPKRDDNPSPAAHIHPTAIIEPGACIGNHTTIGAYAYIGAQVTLGEHNHIHHHATVEGNMTLGAHNHVYPYALIGGKTHDLKYKGGTPGLLIGDHNEFREYTTVHPATDDGNFTRIGNHNHLLAYSHIAHDCQLGSHIVMSGHNALAGHVHVHDHAVIAWGSGVHQYCRIGAHAMASACSKNVKDIPPYMIAEGNPARVRAINKVGLERNGLPPETIERVKKLFRILYLGKLNHTQALEKIIATPDLATTPEALALLDFCRATLRGIA